jgi:hypothetical protein
MYRLYCQGPQVLYRLHCPPPQVLYRLYLAEKLKEPFRKAARRPDAALLAARDASVLESQKVCLPVPLPPPINMSRLLSQ